ncbi:nuclear transport factor 2 family protein [Ruegeria faecimaris]|uniref:nuclear transport factor 2 family protein n=1 Tax=Ruegeria faecimaris TaxID=686389 RepID=UPI0024934113|nr:nuclear transport factor 2 family protein [Ruegeria faecimaris]
MTDTNVIPSFGAMLRLALGDAITAEAGEEFFEMCAEDILFEMPFAPEGAVRELRGRDALLAYLPKAGELIAFESMSLANTHKSTDGETFTLEFTCTAANAETGTRYDQDFISVVRVGNGSIIHYRDYWNPLILLSAVGSAEKLKSHFEEFHNV